MEFKVYFSRIKNSLKMFRLTASMALKDINFLSLELVLFAYCIRYCYFRLVCDITQWSWRIGMTGKLWWLIGSWFVSTWMRHFLRVNLLWWFVESWKGMVVKLSDFARWSKAVKILTVCNWSFRLWDGELNGNFYG